MKKLLTLLILFVSLSVVAQTKKNVETDKNGNYVSPPSKQKVKADRPTCKTYTDSKGKVYPVYKSINDKLYVYKVSKKTGIPYMYYLKV